MDESWIGSWGWVALALVNAGLAEQKNRPRLIWFLASLLLGPFATAYIVIAPAVSGEDVGASSWRASDEPGVVLLGSGLVVLVLSAVPAWIVLFGDGSWVNGVVAAVGATGGISLIVLHVLARRRWRAHQGLDVSQHPTQQP